MTERTAPPPPRFGLFAERYAKYRLVYPAALYDQLLARLKGPRTHAVDLGAGTGQVSLDLLERFERVTAVEPDPAMAALIPARDGLTVVVAKAEDARFPDGSVDAVLIGTAFHWMDEKLVCALAKRWLRPGGVFAVFAYDRFRTPGAPAVQAVLDAEAALWQGHKHQNLARLEAYAARIAATGAFKRVEPLTLEAAWTPTPETLAGFFLTTSFAMAHARATGDEAAYMTDFAARLGAASGGRPIEVRYVIDGGLAVS
jgi:SAM-dependent methyltransferase